MLSIHDAHPIQPRRRHPGGATVRIIDPQTHIPPLGVEEVAIAVDPDVFEMLGIRHLVETIVSPPERPLPD